MHDALCAIPYCNCRQLPVYVARTAHVFNGSLPYVALNPCFVHSCFLLKLFWLHLNSSAFVEYPVKRFSQQLPSVNFQ
ncbi:hypothetical protein ScPMuIL_004619 [Solemya velum]